MDKPFASYAGIDSYVFVCYSHRDAESVYADLVELNKLGVNIWYDEGIPAGTSWRREIASAIKQCDKLIFFVSGSSLNSGHCLREVDYALDNDIEILPVYLDGSILPDELQLSLNRVQALFKKSDPRYLEHLHAAVTNAGGISSVRRLSRSKRAKFIAAAALSVIALAAGLFFYRSTVVESVPRATASETTAPSAFDRYLSGLELLRRWDKDDNLTRAVALFQEASTIDPEFALAFARLSEAQRIQYALTGEDSYLEAAENAARTGMELGPNLAPVQIALGKIHVVQGNTDLAMAAFDRAIELDPNSADANQALAGIYTQLGRTDEAEAAYRRARALEPDNLSVLNTYGNFLYNQSRYSEAASVWQNLVRLAPDHFAALVNLGSALNESGQVAEAITVYEQAIDIQPSYMAYVNLGTSLGEAGRFEEAIATLQQAIELDENDWLAWGNLGYVYSWQDGSPTEANAAFSRAIELGEEARQQNPRDPYNFIYLALYYAKTGNTDLALQRLGTALSLAGDVGEVLAAAAETHELLGNRDMAIDYVREALDQGFPAQQIRLNPEFAELITDARANNFL